MMSEDEKLIRRRLDERFVKTYKDRMILSSNLNLFKRLIKKQMEKELKDLFKKEIEDKIDEYLLFAQKHGRIKIIEWRNFRELDIMPLIIEISKKLDNP